MGRGKAKKTLPLATSFFELGAGDEVRTRDLDLGKVALYQLSYSRNVTAACMAANGFTKVGGFWREANV